MVRWLYAPVRAETVRASARAAEPGPGHADLLHDRLELGAVKISPPGHAPVNPPGQRLDTALQ